MVETQAKIVEKNIFASFHYEIFFSFPQSTILFNDFSSRLDSIFLNIYIIMMAIGLKHFERPKKYLSFNKYLI